MTSTAVWNLLLSRLGKGMARIQQIHDDSVYALPARDWITGPFASAFGHNLAVLGLSNYLPEINDCDDYALYALAFARMCHRKTTSVQAGLAAAAIGYLNQTTFPPVKHRINAFVVSPTEFIFWEPQTQRVVTLTPEEEDSVAEILI